MRTRFLLALLASASILAACGANVVPATHGPGAAKTNQARHYLAPSDANGPVGGAFPTIITPSPSPSPTPIH
jgi:hypothetical protein